MACACTPGGRIKLAACFHFSLDEPPVEDNEPKDLPRVSGDSFWGGHDLVHESLVDCTIVDLHLVFDTIRPRGRADSVFLFPGSVPMWNQILQP